jgi:hypothetical protein
MILWSADTRNRYEQLQLEVYYTEHSCYDYTRDCHTQQCLSCYSYYVSVYQQVLYAVRIYQRLHVAAL